MENQASINNFTDHDFGPTTTDADVAPPMGWEEPPPRVVCFCPSFPSPSSPSPPLLPHPIIHTHNLLTLTLTQKVRTRSMPSLLAFASSEVHGELDWETERYALEERRKLDILSRYAAQGTSVDEVRSKYATTRHRTWRAANLRRFRERRRKEREARVIQESRDKNADGDESGRKKSSSIFDPSRGRFRWILLFFTSFISLGVWVQFDSVGALGQQFKNHTGNGIHLTESNLGALDACYSIPNVILVLFGGIFIDKMGMRLSMILLTGLVLAGALLFNLGLGLNAYWLMIIARTIFGIGGESLYVAQDAFTSHWFEGRDLAFALAVTTVVGRAGDIATFSGWPYLADAWSIDAAMYVVSMVCGFSFVCAIVAAWMDKKAESYAEEDGEEEEIHAEYSVRGVLKFPWAYWIACLLVTVFYSCIVPFQNLAPDFLEANYGISQEASGWYASIISAVSLVASPILGLTLDRWGYRIYLIQLGLICMILGFAMLMMPLITTPIPSLTLLGLAFSIIPAALWPCLVILVPSHLFGTAYGIMEAMINAGNLAMYYGITALLDGQSFFTAIMIFLFMATAGFILSTIWLVLDLKTGNWCNLPTSVQVQYNENEVPMTKNQNQSRSEKVAEEMSVTESETVKLIPNENE